MSKMFCLHLKRGLFYKEKYGPRVIFWEHFFHYKVVFFQKGIGAHLRKRSHKSYPLGENGENNYQE